VIYQSLLSNISTKSITTSSSLIIRKLKKTDTTIIDYLNQEFAALGSKYGAEDLQCYLNSFDPSGISIAEVDGDLVGSTAFHKYSNSYYAAGLYVIREKYRGKGYGMSLVKTAMKEVDWSQIVSSYSAPEMISKYEQFHGMQPRWFVTKYAVDLSKAFEVLKAIHQPSTKGLTVRDFDLVDEGALLSYDANVFGYQRNRFILNWLHGNSNHVKVVVNDNKDIVGYIVARPTYRKQDGYCLRPLFADSTEASQFLLKALFEELITHDSSCSHTVYMDCPNINASIGLMKLLCAKPTASCVYSTTNDIPKGQFIKWFGRP